MSELNYASETHVRRDVGRGIARIDQRTMQKLGISAGDVIEIVNKRTTSAIAWPAYSEDQNRTLSASMVSHAKIVESPSTIRCGSAS